MKKKMIIFGSVIVVLFAALIFVTSYQNNQQVTDAGNPYGQSDLHQATIDQLDDPHYQNQVQPDELSETIESGEPTTVYFYDPTCPHCQETTPRLVPLTDELGVDLKKHNLLEFQESWNTYGIESKIGRAHV